MIITNDHRRILAASKRRELFGHVLAVAGGDDRVRALDCAVCAAERVAELECLELACPSCWRALVRNTEAKDAR